MIETLSRSTLEPRPEVSDEATPPAKMPGLHTVVDDAVLSLVGTAPSVAAWKTARDSAMSIPGSVVADLTELRDARPRVRPERARAVALAVHSAITRAAADASVLVSCDGRVVTLWGRAATREDRTVATVAAWSVPGVRCVQNWIREDC